MNNSLTMEGNTRQFRPLKISLNKLILFVQFTLLCTVISYVTIEGKNVLFIGFSVIGSVLLLLLNRKFPVYESKTVIALLLTLTIGILLNFKNSDILSYVYSVFFVCWYLIFVSFFKQKISPQALKKLAFFVLILYLMVLFIGQAYVFLGLFRGTYISRGLLHGSFGTLYEADGWFRFYSLSSEPSYAAFIVICLLYIIVETEEKQRLLGKEMMVV